MATMEEIVKKADQLEYRGEKREEYLKQEFKLLDERQAREKKEEAERQEKKEEAERQERKEKEEADRKERLEMEKTKLDAEMKLLQAKIEAGIIKNEPDGSGARSSDSGAKHPKLPNFKDGRDDLDIWLTRFERFAESNGWSREKWSSLLCALLTGRALDCYGRLSAEQARNYDKVKEALMKRYDLTEDGYRRKFRTCKLAESESPDMFIVRIVTYLDRWIELSKTDKSYEKLKDLIVREQFMDACPEDLATSLREKDLPTLERVAKQADLFLKARNRNLCDPPRKVFPGNARPRIDSVGPFEPEKKFNGGQRAGEAKTSFLRMPFGMMNSGAMLTRAVKKLLCRMDNVVDDLLIHTETWEAHVKTLSELFKRLQEANFNVRPVKCLLGSRTVDFLGHSLGRGTIGFQDENVEKVRNASRPKTKREVREFLGLVGYYKEFVPNFAAVSAPLSDLVRKGQPNNVNWGDSQERAYNSLKVAVTSKPVLQLPDVNKRFVLRTDASNRGLGAALMQEIEGTLFPVAYASKKIDR
ncbi:Pol polyprotein [Plakobranchus ocellatus]|uniref:Pol polyprotein n=1 Tax=Plakobranchus ocellatus TaxID=259542 RepID=A0AAV4DXQ9_9GAST|nr:Pol polyprotein [Plakobranchus ocellatus]